MFVVGRLVGRVDTRLILLTGLGLSSIALLMMSHFSLTMDAKPFVVSGVVQGLGIGLLFVPLSVTAFATLPPAMRNEGTAVYTLVRNLGSSIGISLMEALDTRQAAVAHADMAGALSPGNPAQSALLPPVGGGAGPGASPALDLLNGEITRQASMVALVDVFRLMLLMTICIAPLLLIMRKPRSGPASGEVVVE
jgi:DHA2 family multidrug resistance protein